jgi:diguanylate cyclase (GGDEF)-like protein
LWPIAKRTAVWAALGAAFIVLLWRLRQSDYLADPLLESYLEFSGCLIAFTIAAISLVHFRGAHDRVSLILALGFLLSSFIDAGSRLVSYHSLVAHPIAHGTVSEAWMVSRTLLAVLMVAALVVERHLPVARNSDREIAGAILIVAVAGYLTGVAYFVIPAEAPIHVGAIVPRPWDLLPTAIYLVATVWFWRRIERAHSAFDRAICLTAGLNVVCHLAMTQSQRLFDAPFAFAQLLKVVSYATALGGALFDHGRLFDQVHHLAVSDPLTGLANYRRFMEVLDGEMQRSGRTGRPFAVLLLDLDGLKSINDRYGHLVGSQALCRLANIFRMHCRSIDTAARYGGDEFAVILPETGAKEARQVAARIHDQLAHDARRPTLSMGAGIAVYPADGATAEQLLRVADRALYGMKARKRKKVSEHESPPAGSPVKS